MEAQQRAYAQRFEEDVAKELLRQLELLPESEDDPEEETQDPS